MSQLDEDLATLDLFEDTSGLDDIDNFLMSQFIPSKHTYSRQDIGDGDIVIMCSDCGAYVLNKTESDVKHCKTCIPGDAERWREHYSQDDVISDEEEERLYALQNSMHE